MIKNFFKLAWRNTIRHKMHAIVNITGLALGITCCLFIFLWVHDEQSVDNFHNDSKNLYTAYLTVTAGGKVNNTYTTPMSFNKGTTIFALEDITASIPEIKHFAFYATAYDLPWGHPETFQFGDKQIKLEGARAGSDFFKMFSYPLIKGNAETALKEINGVAVSRKMAGIFFGSPEKAMGKILRFEDRANVVVTAVFEDIGNNSSLKFDYMFNWEAQKHGMNWSSNDFQTFIQLSPTANVTSVEAKLNQLIKTRTLDVKGVQVKLSLQPFGDQYLHNIFVNGKPTAGRIEYVRIFSGVAVFILIIACINFMNLATARAAKRAKEIGLRKVIGSTRSQLIGQFFSEALFFAFMAMLLSVVLMLLLLPAFNNFTGKHIAPPVGDVSFWLTLIGLTFITGVIAGSYPALYLSSLQPVRILKGVLSFSRGAALFRKGLTVFQFMLSIVLIIATIIISRQVSYVQNAHLGYDRENLVFLRVEGELIKPEKYKLFKTQLSQMPGIAMVDRASEAPHAMDFVVDDAINWEGKEKNASVGFKPSSVGFDFLKLMHLQIADGRGFSREMITDTSAYMVNEEAVREMGMKHPIGKWISAWQKRGHIIGILKDFHTQSLREPIKPVVLDVKENLDFGFVIIRTQAGKTKTALNSINEIYKEVNPAYPIAYQFVDEEYKKLYNNEMIISGLTVLFASLAIVISCLGLLGLVMFAAEQRVREISVRKVLGASMGQIIILFSQDFLKLIALAFLMAAPLAWYAMHQWLQGFAYRVDISWWVFVLAAAVSVIIALITMSYQAVKAAVANPIKGLRAD